VSEATQGHYAHTKEAALLQGAQKGRRIKVVMLGAGSGFTEPLMTDILNIPALDGGSLLSSTSTPSGWNWLTS